VATTRAILSAVPEKLAVGPDFLSLPLFSSHPLLGPTPKAAATLRSSGDPHWWKLAEAALNVMSRTDTAVTVLETIKAGKVCWASTILFWLWVVLRPISSPHRFNSICPTFLPP
jgi:hypothetical protein